MGKNAHSFVLPKETYGTIPYMIMTPTWKLVGEVCWSRNLMSKFHSPNNRYTVLNMFLTGLLRNDIFTFRCIKITRSGVPCSATARATCRLPCREGQCYGVIPPGTDVGPDGQPKAHPHIHAMVFLS